MGIAFGFNKDEQDLVDEEVAHSEEMEPWEVDPDDDRNPEYADGFDEEDYEDEEESEPEDDESAKFPSVHVQLIGRDGNAFSILGNVMREMRRAGIDQAEIDAFKAEATAGDYNNLLSTCIKWVTVY